MKMRLFFVVATALLFSVFGLAQETEKQKSATEPQTNSATPVTSEDLQKDFRNMQNALDKVTQEVRQTAEQTETQRLTEEKRRADEKAKADSAAILARQAEEKRLDDIAAQAVQDREALKAQHARTMLAFYIGLPVLLIAIIASAIVVVKKRGQQKIEVVAVSKKEEIPELRTNPTALELREFSERNGNMKEIPFFLDLGQTGKYMCTAHMQPNREDGTVKDPLFQVGDNAELVSWDKRKQHASKHQELAIK